MSAMTGRASITGLPAALSYGVVTIHMSPHGANFSHNFSEKQLENATGEIIGFYTSKEEFDFSIDYTPISPSLTSNTISTAADSLRLLAPNQAITISGLTTGSAVAGYLDMNGTYNYKGGMTVALDPDGYIRCTIPLKYHKGSSTVMSAASLGTAVA
jgi:hypothetical protein